MDLVVWTLVSMCFAIPVAFIGLLLLSPSMDTGVNAALLTEEAVDLLIRRLADEGIDVKDTGSPSL